ncbi:sulfate permease [Nesterenkonia sp. CL21]|uniref:sulfate permease n=1 Tax=Nesterenkonia sp. CL21 TaxID=3064894 RepID=UPI00287A40DE|nr:sulfate permease [Nesterenkonia sp. CL21]MDS2172372.1 sulfate permease [Nesterenkonia sp. CL21]
MIRLIWAASVHIRYFLRRYMPTNILLDLIRTRRGLKWGVPAMLLAIPYLFAAAICRNLMEDGGSDWLNLLVLLFIYNAMKFAITGPVSLVLLAKTRLRERALLRQQLREVGEVADPLAHCVLAH